MKPPQKSSREIPQEGILTQQALKGERIAKRIAHAGLCSRRDAEQWIMDGRVQIDGEVILTPAIVVLPHQIIHVDGVLLSAPAQPRLWGYFKPDGVITTHKDPQGRPTVFQQLPENMPRVISIGRLDLNSEGILLLTTDSQLARYAELPQTGWARRYRVRVYGDLPFEALAELEAGIEVEGVRYGPIYVEVTREAGRNSWLLMTLFEGKNREIRRVLQHLGLHVNRLIRVAYGPFLLGDYHPGDLWEIPLVDFAQYFPHLKSFVKEAQKSSRRDLNKKAVVKPSSSRNGTKNAPHRRKV